MKRVKTDKNVKQEKLKKTKDKNAKTQSIKPASRSLITAIISGIISLVLCLVFIPDSSELLGLSVGKNLFYGLSVLYSLVIFISLLNQNYSASLSKYMLFISIIFFLTSSIIPFSGLQLFNFTVIKSFLTAPTALIGIVTVWLFRDNLNEVIAVMFKNDSVSSIEASFSAKFFKPFKDLFLKKNLIYTFGLSVVLALSVYTMFNKLDAFDLYSDEAQVTEGAAGYYHTGEFKQWDFVKDELKDRKYKRGFPHLFLVAQSYKLFGVTPWAGRFVSAFFGLLLVFIGYFIAYYFTKNRLASLLIIFAFAFYFEYLLLFRWTRMYAVLIPSFLLLFYFSYKLLTEKSKLKFINDKPILKEYFNFNFILLIPFVLLLVFSYYLHLNALFILFIMLIFSVLSFIIFKEKKYLTISGFGLIIFIIALSLPQFSRFTSRFTFFEMDNTLIYSHFTAGFPFNLNLNLVILISGIFLVFLIKDIDFRKKTLFIYLTGILSFILFSYILEYSVSFRYMSFTSPPIIILIIGILSILIKTFYHKIMQGFLIILLLASIVVNFGNRYNDLYVKNYISPAYPSLAFKDITDNYKEGELIYRHWVPMIYLDDIPSSSEVKLIGSYKGRPFHEVYDTLQSYPGGWLTWHSHNRDKIDSLVSEYADIYFTKYHGHGVDTTGVELFYYSLDMLQDTNLFKQRRSFPLANVNLNNTYSVAFQASLSGKFKNSLFDIRSAEEILFEVKPDSLNLVSLIFNYATDNTFLESDIFKDTQKHHVVWYQTGGKKGDKFGLFIDGKKVTEKVFSSDQGKLGKFKLNLFFRDFIDDIQIYDHVLTEEHIKIIISNRDNPVFEKFIYNDESYTPLYRWKKR